MKGSAKKSLDNGQTFDEIALGITRSVLGI